MYNIIQLNDKSLSELQTIAQELGIKKTDALKKEELVYKILDEQAIAGATKKVAADKLKEERKADKQKRTRSKKETSDKTTAPKAAADKAGATEQNQPAEKPARSTDEQLDETAAKTTKRKPGRPRKVKADTDAQTAELPFEEKVTAAAERLPNSRLRLKRA